MMYKIRTELFGSRLFDGYGRPRSLEIVSSHDRFYWRLDWLGDNLDRFLEDRSPREVIEYLGRCKFLFVLEDLVPGSPERKAAEALKQVRDFALTLPSASVFRVYCSIQNSSLISRPADSPKNGTAVTS